jgi:hypothetical protein
MVTTREQNLGAEASEEQVIPTSETQVEETASSGEVDASESQPKSELEILKDKAGELEHTVRSLQGQLTTRVANQELRELKAELQGLKREVRRVSINQEDLDDTERQQKQDAASEEERTEQAKLEASSRGKRLGSRLVKMITRSGISMDDPWVKELSGRWETAPTENDLEDLFDEADEYASNYSAKTQDKTRREKNEETNSLGVGVGHGPGSASITDQEKVNRLGRGASMTALEIKEAGDLMDTKGIFPKL